MKKRAKEFSNETSMSFIFPMKTEIDIDLLNVLASGANPHFLTCSYQVKDARQMITFDIRGSYSLRNYIDRRFDNLIFFLSECFAILHECRVNNIPLSNIVIDPDTGFIQNGHLKLIVLPLVGQSHFNTKSFYRNVIRSFFLSARLKSQLLHILKTARDEGDIFSRIDAELRRLQTKPSQPPDYFKGKTASNETECMAESFDGRGAAFSHYDENATTFLDSDNEEATTFLGPDIWMESKEE